MQSLWRGDVRLAYVEAGSGAPPLLLVHGFCGNHRHLAPQFDYFRHTQRVVAVDRRGHGDSDKPGQAYTIEDDADDLAWLCCELGIYKPVVLVQSVAAIGFALIGRYPELVRALILVEPLFASAPAVRTAHQPGLEDLRGSEYQAALAKMVERLFSLHGECHPQVVAAVAEMLHVPQHVVLSTWEHFLAYDGDSAAAACRLPLLAIHGSEAGDLAQLRRSCPHAHIVQVGKGRFPCLVAPDETNRLIERFLASL